MKDTIAIIMFFLPILICSILIINAFKYINSETDNLKYSVERLESRIDELYSYYNSINTKIKEVEEKLEKVKEILRGE